MRTILNYLTGISIVLPFTPDNSLFLKKVWIDKKYIGNGAHPAYTLVIIKVSEKG